MRQAHVLGYFAAPFPSDLPLGRVELCKGSGLLASGNCRKRGHAYTAELPLEKEEVDLLSRGDSQVPSQPELVNVARDVAISIANRVYEVLLSSLSPFQLMAGKILGICAVGLTLLTLWSSGGLIAASFVVEE